LLPKVGAGIGNYCIIRCKHHPRRYNRCRWDFPESDAAKYSGDRLALPEILAQFDRVANLTE